MEKPELLENNKDKKNYNQQNQITVILRIYYGKMHKIFQPELQGNVDTYHKVNLDDKIEKFFDCPIRKGISELDILSTFHKNNIHDGDVLECISTKFDFVVKVYRRNEELHELKLSASWDYSFYNVKQLIKVHTGIEESKLNLGFAGSMLKDNEHFTDRLGWSTGSRINASIKD